MVKELTDVNFKSEVLDEKKKTVLVDFWASWCGPCRMQTPILEQFEKAQSKTVKICKLNTDEYGEIASGYGIISIPTLIVFKNGKAVKKAVGVQNPDGLKKLVSLKD
jgi:thioredoxin 1